MPFSFASLIPAAVSLFSGKRQAASVQDTNRANDARNTANVQQQDIWRQQDRIQSERFARESAGWQMDDLMRSADKAGIHRLAAIGGASAAQYSPSSSTPSDPIPQDTPDSGYIGDAVGDAVGRIFAQKKRATEEKVADAQIDVLKSEAELNRARSRTQIRAARNAALSGPQPVDDDFRETKEKLVQKFKMPDGSVREVTVGPDIDEVIMGGILYGYDKALDLFVPKQPRSTGKAAKRPNRNTSVPTITPPSRKQRRTR